MRISDWSADVCSSDLSSFDLVVSAGALHLVNDLPGALALIRRVLKPDGLFLAAFPGGASLTRTRAALLAGDIAATDGAAPRIAPLVDVRAAGDLLGRAGFALPVGAVEAVRSEEHTSELQTLMRISYAVFCLKKKKTKIHQIHKKLQTGCYR